MDRLPQSRQKLSQLANIIKLQGKDIKDAGTFFQKILQTKPQQYLNDIDQLLGHIQDIENNRLQEKQTNLQLQENLKEIERRCAELEIELQEMRMRHGRPPLRGLNPTTYKLEPKLIKRRLEGLIQDLQSQLIQNSLQHQAQEQSNSFFQKERKLKQQKKEIEAEFKMYDNIVTENQHLHDLLAEREYQYIQQRRYLQNQMEESERQHIQQCNMLRDQIILREQQINILQGQLTESENQRNEQRNRYRLRLQTAMEGVQERRKNQLRIAAKSCSHGRGSRTFE